jgi:hypothetical protein
MSPNATMTQDVVDEGCDHLYASVEESWHPARYLETAIGVRDGTYDAFSTTTTSTRSVPCSSSPTRLAAASERSMMRRFPAP